MIDKLKSKILHFSWDLAYGEYNESIITNGIDWKKIHIIKNPYEKKKWFADPFVLDNDDTNLELLVEEFDYSINRGRIARLVINKTANSITECHIVLDLDTHLSFPAIYRMGSDFWVCPENSASGKCFVYRYDRVNDKFCDKTLLVEAPLTDPIILEKSGKYQIISTMLPDPNGNQMQVFESDSFFGPYRHTDTLSLLKKNARNAGGIINSTSNGFIRPSQDCDEDYGKAVIFDKDVISWGKIEPQGIKYAGLHTFNVLGSVFVIDLKKYDYPLIYNIKEKLKWRKK